MELGPRDILSRAIIEEIEKGHAFDGPYGEYVHLDIRHLGQKTIDKRLPFVRELTTRFVGIDPVHEPIPVRPVVHYMMGGVDSDGVGRTPLPGLYAAGEAACVSINGANRLGSNSLTECLVFGARVGKQAAHDALSGPAASNGALLSQTAQEEQDRLVATYLEGGEGGERIAPIRRELQETMERGAGVFRTEGSLKESVEDVARLKERYRVLALDDHDRAYNTELVAALELANMLEVAETVLWSALERRESRGSHTRRDYPERDDGRFLKHSLALVQPGEPPGIDYRDVTITRWPPAERKY
jgi:fumarate reductase flavoprotein subunit